MLKSEVADLLALAAATDNRKVGQADVEAWHAVLTQALGERLRFDDARFALLEHYGSSREYLMPVAIVEFVKKLRRTRRAKVQLCPPADLVDAHGYPDPEDAEKYAAWIAWRKTALQAVENGEYQADPPPDVLRRSIAEVDNAAEWPVQPWPSEHAGELEAGLKPRDMSAIGDVFRTVPDE